MISIHKRRDQAGDTIVEVLIAMAVTSLMLGGAFATANTSLQNTIQAQERSEAMKVAEMEVEILNTLSQLKSGDPSYINVYDPANPVFCLHTTGVKATPFSLEVINSSDANLPSASDQLNNYQTCTFASDGTSGPSYRYNTAIIYDFNTRTFTIQERWLRLGGNFDQLQIKYRAYDGS
ncbi:MAG: hypothetical protein NVS1B7_2690 [Candidatus Saccharimonadales bacterium]